MIVFNNVTKYFPTKNGRKYILRDVSFTLKTGENVGVIGPNGAGKTTMMRLICGVDIPNSGRIDTTYFLSWPMGIAGGLQGGMSGRENAKFVCRILGEHEDQIAEKLKFIQDFAEIGNDFELPVRNYSSGMRARLNFAISMGFDFDCYVVDELTAVGDQKFREKSAKFFKDKREEACFIKVSHNLKELEDECDSALFLMDGNLYYFPEVMDGINSYKAVIKGDTPPDLKEYLVNKPPKGSEPNKDWFAALAFVDLKAQGKRLKEHGLKMSAPLLQQKPKKLRIPPAQKVQMEFPVLGEPEQQRRSIAPPAPRPVAAKKETRKSERFARATDVVERVLEHKKILPPG